MMWRTNTLVLHFDDLDTNKIPDWVLSDTGSGSSLPAAICSYDDENATHNEIINFINTVAQGKSNCHIHIDYSSMPRSWYCGLPHKLSKRLLTDNIQLIFWYVAGEYPDAYESYPTAGIASLKLFSGGALPKIDSQRTHLIALSYDVIRTQSLLSTLEPDFLVVCYAYVSDAKKREIVDVNAEIIRQAAVSLPLPINDFPYMLSKINEIILEQTLNGQIVLIPDGPKPLIFAMSLASLLVNIKDGLTCFHVKRNDKLLESKIDVSAHNNEIFGVKINIERQL